MITLVAAAVISLVVVAILATDIGAPPGPSAAPYAPEFRDFLEQTLSSDPGSAALSDGSGSAAPALDPRKQALSGDRALGLIPRPVALPDTSPTGSSAAGVSADGAAAAGGSPPSAYDLRREGRVTPVRSQDPFGTCWAFGSLSSVESNLLVTGYAACDLSEDNLARTAGFDYSPYTGGGHELMAAAQLSRSGPVAEADDPYGDGATPAGLQPRYRLHDMLYICSGEADRTAIKNALMSPSCGALYTTICWTDTAYRSDTCAYYYNGDAITNHAVTIVGWDDHYSAADFVDTPPGDGAWIVKNSWGSAWGSGGYFYLSYYDVHAGDVACSFVAGAVGDYTTIYQHDPLGWVESWGWDGATTQWGANDFTAVEAGRLVSVGFYTNAPNTAYRIFTAAAHDDARTARGSGTMANMGYHTVELTTPLTLAAGEAFSVIVELSHADSDYLQAVEAATPGYSSAAVTTAGQSWMSLDGSTWYDVSAAGYGINVCIKAFMRPAANDGEAPDTTLSGASSGWSTTPVTLALSADDGDGWGVLYSETSLDEGDWRQGTRRVVAEDGVHTVAYRSVDRAGNVEQAGRVEVLVDGTPPRTTTVRRVTGWSRHAVKVRLRGADATSGVQRVEYRIDGGAWTHYRKPVVVSRQGKTAVSYRSVDVSGNVESPAHVETVRIDRDGPRTAALGSAGGERGRAVTFRFRVTDRTEKARVIIRVFSETKLVGTLKAGWRVCGSAQTYVWKKCSLAGGKYTWKVYATDEAGNTQVKTGSKMLTVK